MTLTKETTIWYDELKWTDARRCRCRLPLLLPHLPCLCLCLPILLPLRGNLRNSLAGQQLARSSGATKDGFARSPPTQKRGSRLLDPTIR